MKKITIIAVLLFNFSILYAQQSSPAAGDKNLTYKIISSTGKTWGYDIYKDGKLMVHQPTIPALPRYAGFATKVAAVIVAKKVMEKIEKGVSPPSISIDEMKQLGAISK